MRRAGGGDPCRDLPPPREHYNRLAKARDIRCGDDQRLRFVAPDPAARYYEEHIFTSGAVPTRDGDWHDAYNAEVWLEFPLAKAAINRRHVDALRAARVAGRGARGTLRDRLTQFDECGVVVAGMRTELWRALCAHCWGEVFVAHREELVATTRFVIFGHGSRDALRAPFVGLCGKALRVDAAPDDGAAIDAELARRIASAEFLAERLLALPLLGIPGITADSEDPAYYDDARQFRPPRTMATGSSPGSR